MPLFGDGGTFHVNPDVMSTVQNDYWEEFNRVNDVLSHEPEIEIRRVQKNRKVYPVIHPTLKQQNNNDAQELSKFDPHKIPDANRKLIQSETDGDEEFLEFRSIAVQTDGNYDDYEPELPYPCCFCFRTSTPWIVWFFVAISIIFFKMGAIITGRWIYLTSASFDEVVFYIAFSVCLGFGTIYFRRGTKYHNPYDLLFLILTIPIMWALLTFTTFFLKRDIFFYVGSVIYSTFVLPYTLMGIYIAHRFWKHGKLFLKRVEGNAELEPLCRKLFFTQSFMVFDTQLAICASIVSMAPTVNQNSTGVWIASLIVAPICIGSALISLIFGYFGIRRESRKLTWVFTILSMTNFALVFSMFMKRPTGAGIYYTFINAAILSFSTGLLVCHIGLLAFLWTNIVPNYKKGLKGPVNRTSRNNCIQCVGLTVCR